MSAAILIPAVIFGACWLHGALVNGSWLPTGGQKDEDS